MTVLLDLRSRPYRWARLAREAGRARARWCAIVDRLWLVANDSRRFRRLRAEAQRHGLAAIRAGNRARLWARVMPWVRA